MKVEERQQAIYKWRLKEMRFWRDRPVEEQANRRIEASQFSPFCRMTVEQQRLFFPLQWAWKERRLP